MDVTVESIKSMKGKEKIAVLTAYGYAFGKICDKAGIDIVLVGDSLGMVVLGYENTRQVTMDDMIRHTKAVFNGCKNSLIVSDLPYKSDSTPGFAVENAKKLINAGADAVKPEGKPEICKALVKAGINVMGHIGLLPQTAIEFKVQGKEKKEAEKIMKQAIELEQSGCFAIVLECIPSALAKQITETISIPTIGIGAGHYCDGQVLVSNDMLGLYDKLQPKFVKKYAHLAEQAKKAIIQYKEEVKKGVFPDKDHSFE